MYLNFGLTTNFENDNIKASQKWERRQGGDIMKRLIVDLDEELHKKMKIKALQDDKTVKQYIANLIEKDVETKKEQTQ